MMLFLFMNILILINPVDDANYIHHNLIKHNLSLSHMNLCYYFLSFLLIFQYIRIKSVLHILCVRKYQKPNNALLHEVTIFLNSALITNNSNPVL